MVDERIILQVLAEQKDEIQNYKPLKWVTRNEEKMFELDNSQVQVAYDINAKKTYKRETSALINASSALSCDNLLLIAFTKSREVELSGKTIHIKSALDWLLEK